MVLGRLPPYGEPEDSPDCSQASSLSAEEIVVVYHERTKHHYHRFAASVGYMDWATQPDPFRCYEGASLVRLPFPEMGEALPYWQLYVADSMEPAPLSIDSVSLFLRYALSLTAWKRFHETTWSLRANPSSGNLHPTEGYALLPAVGAIHERPGVYHYAPKEHGLERRADVDPSVWWLDNFLGRLHQTSVRSFTVPRGRVYSPRPRSTNISFGMNKLGCRPIDEISCRRKRVPALLTRSWPSERKYLSRARSMIGMHLSGFCPGRALKMPTRTTSFPCFAFLRCIIRGKFFRCPHTRPRMLSALPT